MDGGQLSSADLPFGTRTGSRTLVLGVLGLWTDNALRTGQPEEKVLTSGDCGLAEEYRRTEYNSRIDKLQNATTYNIVYKTCRQNYFIIFDSGLPARLIYERCSTYPGTIRPTHKFELIRVWLC